MRTDRTVLRLGKIDGNVREVPMRYNESHQRGYRCFIGLLADAPDDITEETPRSFEGRGLFDALAVYRRSIEPEGWLLLHAVARKDCWPKPDDCSPYVFQLTPGTEDKQRIDGFASAYLDQVTTLRQQQTNFEAWINSLPPLRLGRIRPRSGHEHDEPGVEFSRLAKAAGEILVDGQLNADRILKSVRSRKSGTQRPVQPSD